MTKYFYLLLLVLPLIISPAAAAEELSFDADYAMFQGEAGRTIAEIYLLVRRNLFSWQKTNAQFSGTMDVETLILKDNIAIYRQADVITDQISDTTNIAEHIQIPYQFVLHMEPGDYKIQIKLKDHLKPARYKKKIFDLPVPLFAGDTLRLSQIELGLQAFISGQPGPFTKYGYDIIPYSSLLFTEKVNHFYYFAEIYNLTTGRKAQYQYHYEITNSAGKTVCQSQPLTMDTPASMSIILDEAVLPDLPSDIYMFHLITEDFAGKRSTRAEKKFYYSKPMDFAAGETAVMASMNEIQLDSLYRILEPLMTSFEINIYKNSGVTGKREFFNKFWQQRDPTPKTPLNEYRTEIENRIRQADAKFSKQMFYGPFTDRGKVLIKYGNPSDIESYLSRMEGKPYEIWYYNNLEGGVKFVFIDENGLGNLELIHSTKSGEITNEYWNLEIQE